jgi:GpV Apex motif
MFGSLEMGVVVATYPQGNSLDVLMTRTGARLSNVQMMSHDASSNSGTANLPSIGNALDDTRWNFVQDPARTVYAIMGNIGGMPFCLGLLYPQTGQMQFAAPDQKIVRHSSDFYELTQANGDHEMAHPSGSFFKLGSNGTHTDLTGHDVDQQWKIANNTGAAGHAHLTVAAAGAVVATIDVDSAGNIAINHNGALTVNTQGTAHVTVTGAATLKAPTVTVDSPQSTFTGAVTVEGPFTFESGMTGSAGSSGGNTMNIDGDAHYTGTVTADVDVVAASISGKGHKHPGVQSGGSETDPPTN